MNQVNAESERSSFKDEVGVKMFVFHFLVILINLHEKGLP
jgi:hypothetical protein